MLKNHDGTVFNLMTYSIVARDPHTGEIGVAVQTCWPGVGAVVPWVEPAVGAVATQASTNVDFGPTGLALLREGRAAADALREMVDSDPDREVRQVALVDGNGRTAAHTGSACVAAAGHLCEPGVSVQGNMLERSDAWPAMLDAFRSGTGDLADRLLSALRAAEEQGGDIRGSQSAALLVAPGSADARPWARRFDLRVDESPRPVAELERMLRVARAYEALEAALDAAEAGELETALEATMSAQRLAPDDAQVAFWHTVVLIENGRPTEAEPFLDAALRSEPRLSEFGHRYGEAGHGALLSRTLGRVPRPTL